VRDRSACHAGELVAYEVLRDVFQLALIQSGATQRHQSDRNAGSVLLQDNRRIRAGGMSRRSLIASEEIVAASESGSVPVRKYTLMRLTPGNERDSIWSMRRRA